MSKKEGERRTQRGEYNFLSIKVTGRAARDLQVLSSAGPGPGSFPHGESTDKIGRIRITGGVSECVMRSVEAER